MSKNWDQIPNFANPTPTFSSNGLNLFRRLLSTIYFDHNRDI